MISARETKQLDATTMFTYSHANTPLGQSERAYYLSYFIIDLFGYERIRERSVESMTCLLEYFNTQEWYEGP